MSATRVDGLSPGSSEHRPLPPLGGPHPDVSAGLLWRPQPDPQTAAAMQPRLITAIAGAVLATPGVHSLYAGKLDFSTYLPGRRVKGVQVTERGYDIHVVLVAGAAALTVVEAIRAAVEVHTPGRVDVTVEKTLPRKRGRR